MRRKTLAMIAVLLMSVISSANSQSLDARRTAMGGVALASGTPSSATSNVAYRAVPGLAFRSSGLALPIGLVGLLTNPPVLNPDDPDFNVYEIANIAYNIPWNIQLVSPTVPSNDIVVSVGRNSLAVELGEVGDLFPEDGSKFGQVSRLPTIGFGVGDFFAGASGLVDFQNDLRVSPELHRALANGESFEANTAYSLYDDAHGQAALLFETGWAAALSTRGNPREDGTGFYAGARVKMLRGMAYADGTNQVTFSTNDTLLSTSPIELQYQGLLHDAGPDGGGWGTGVDLGAVWLQNGLEVGVGINDIGAKIPWKVRERVAVRNGIDNDYEFVTLGEDMELTAKIPMTTTVNLARRIGATLLAADYVRRGDDNLTHFGIERWFGMWAVRTGFHIDDHQLQYASGAGLRLGRVGFDVALATHNRTISRERGLELAAGLSLYQ